MGTHGGLGHRKARPDLCPPYRRLAQSGTTKQGRRACLGADPHLSRSAHELNSASTSSDEKLHLCRYCHSPPPQYKHTSHISQIPETNKNLNYHQQGHLYVNCPPQHKSFLIAGRVLLWGDKKTVGLPCLLPFFFFFSSPQMSKHFPISAEHRGRQELKVDYPGLSACRCLIFETQTFLKLVNFTLFRQINEDLQRTTAG